MGPSRCHALMYHDVVEPSHADASGFSGSGPGVYKLSPERFEAHLDAIARATGEPPQVDVWATPEGSSWAITFDDGGVSAWDRIAGRLEARGWRGIFFVTTGRIGTPGFLDPEQIRDLHRRGHRIGSHSVTHPKQMSACSWSDLVAEWNTSREALASLTGEPVRMASVPGGFHSREVAEAAAHAGFDVLFTSEPSSRREWVDGCLVTGRYAIRRDTTPRTAAGFAAGRRIPRYRQAWAWSIKKAAKAVAGGSYARFRAWFLERDGR